MEQYSNLMVGGSEILLLAQLLTWDLVIKLSSQIICHVLFTRNASYIHSNIFTKV